MTLEEEERGRTVKGLRSQLVARTFNSRTISRPAQLGGPLRHLRLSHAHRELVQRATAIAVPSHSVLRGLRLA